MKHFTMLALILLLSFILVACGATGTDGGQANEEAPVDITVQLKWLHNPQFAGFYVAQRNGFYEAENLNVVLTPGGPGVDTITPVIDGTAQFAISFGDSVLRRAINGDELVAIGATYQQNPYVFMAIRDEDGNDPIQSAEDLEGHTVASNEGDLMLFGILNSFGLTESDINRVGVSQAVGPLVEGELDMMNGFITNQVIALQSQGVDLQILRPEDYGVLIYQDLLFTTNDMVENNPDVVARFMRATLRGWERAQESEDEVIAALVSFDASIDTDNALLNWQAAQPLIYDDGQLLRIETSFIDSMQELMLLQGTLTESVDSSAYFTNEFLETGE